MRALDQKILQRGSMFTLAMCLAFEPVGWPQEAHAQDAGQEDGYTQSQDASTSAPATASPAHAFSEQQLDQMLAPIALYPDPLLSQILMASTYPLEVVQAARWSRANPNLQGDAAVRAIQERDWDPSVKSLVAFPRILQMMDEKLDWMERLGDAFLSQEEQVMDRIQYLRQKAYAAGNLRSNDQVHVESQGQTIVVEPASPEIIYVPYYDPLVVYGTWWWPDYPPIYWGPWPGYYVDSGFAWGAAIIITAGFFFGDFDWGHHRVHVVHVNNFYYRRFAPDRRDNGRFVNAHPGEWHHDPAHRRGVPYRDTSLRNQYGHPGESPESRRNFRGYDQPSFGQPSPGERGRPGAGTRGRGGDQPRPEFRARPETRTLPETPAFPQTRALPEMRTQPETPPRQGAGVGTVNRQLERGVPARQSEPRVVSPRPVEVRPPALEGIGRGREERNYGARGRSSFEGAAQGPRSAPQQRRFDGSSGGGGGRQSR